MEMVTIGSVRYRTDYAERHGLVPKPAPKTKKAPAPKDKKRRMVLNKKLVEPEPVEPEINEPEEEE